MSCRFYLQFHFKFWLLFMPPDYNRWMFSRMGLHPAAFFIPRP